MGQKGLTNLIVKSGSNQLISEINISVAANHFCAIATILLQFIYEVDKWVINYAYECLGIEEIINKTLLFMSMIRVWSLINYNRYLLKWEK